MDPNTTLIEAIARALFEGVDALMEYEAPGCAERVLQALHTEGYVVVPVEPTEPMLEAGRKAHALFLSSCGQTWSAMIQATSPRQASTQEDEQA